MNRSRIDTRELSDILSSISHYETLASIISQIDKDQEEKTKAFYDECLHGAKYMGEGYSYDKWLDINIHITRQLWGSTACGWGGMGGAAMTYGLNVVIENKSNKAVFVYWNSKLAYIARIDEKLEQFSSKAYNHMPSMSDASRLLNVIYYNRKRQ